MLTALFIFFILSIFHLFYQSLLLPTIRLDLRFKLFRLRDKLRKLKLEKGSELDDKIMYDLQKMINANIKNLAYIDFETIYETKKYFDENPKLNSKVEYRRQLLDSSPLQEVKDIYKESVRLFLLTIGANSGGWVVYIVPALIIALMYGSIKNSIKKMLFLPEYDIEKVVSAKIA